MRVDETGELLQFGRLERIHVQDTAKALIEVWDDASALEVAGQLTPGQRQFLDSDQITYINRLVWMHEKNTKQLKHRLTPVELLHRIKDHDFEKSLFPRTYYEALNKILRKLKQKPIKFIEQGEIR